MITTHLRWLDPSGVEVFNCPDILGTSGMGSFQILEHTGEIGILARGSTPAGTFSQDARAMYSFMLDLGAVEQRESRRIEVEAPDIEALLVAWLNELIYLFDADGMVFNKFDIQEMGETSMRAVCYGEPLDMERHQFEIGPKAATYHMLEFKQESDGSGWQARVILDI